MKISYYLLGIALCCLSCSSSTANKSSLAECPIVATQESLNGNPLIVADYEKIDPQSTINYSMSDFCEWYELIKLDSSSSDYLLSQNHFFSVSDNYIAALTGNDPILLFNKSGKFICQVGSKEGPGGYDGSYFNVDINERNKEIFISLFRSLKVYDLYTGEVKYNIPISKENLLIGVVSLCLDNGNLLVACAPGASTDRVIWETDKEGNQIKAFPASYFQDEKFTSKYMGWGTTSSVHFTKNDTEYITFTLSPLAIPMPDSLYHYYPESGVLIPAFTMSYPDKEHVPQHFQYETPSYYYTVIMGANDITDLLGWSNHPSLRILIDRKTLKGSAIRLCLDKHGMLDVSDERSWIMNGYFALNLTPDRLQTLIEQQLQKNPNMEDVHKKKLQEMYDSIDIDDNNYALIGKVK